MLFGFLYKSKINIIYFIFLTMLSLINLHYVFQLKLILMSQYYFTVHGRVIIICNKYMFHFIWCRISFIFEAILRFSRNVSKECGSNLKIYECDILCETRTFRRENLVYWTARVELSFDMKALLIKAPHRRSFQLSFKNTRAHFVLDVFK